MKLSDVPANERPEWNKKWLRFKRKWIKENSDKLIHIKSLLELFCKKHGLEIE